MLFSDVIGHNKIKSILTRSVRDSRIGHAYLFEGPEGVGKLSLARAFAQMIVCENFQTDDSCGVCASCSRAASQNHPDVTIVTNQFYDASKKSSDILVDTIRSMKSDVYIKPFLGERKIYIIPKADTMNVSAQNSLLKVLEEPPEYCTIILLAENREAFLPTILSRVSAFKFFALTDDEVEKYLAENFEETDPSQRRLLAKMSGGSIKKAIELLENPESRQLREDFFDCIFSIPGGSRKTIYDFSLFIKQNKDEFEFLINILQSIFCDALHILQTQNAESISNTDKKVKIQKLSDSVDTKNILKALEAILKANDYFSKNIGVGTISQCLGLELWEAINDRSYRSKV
ncbi:MAG: DNA polymerase III subunit delta' [Clostridia bacterium]|nr:DNA polymerase III subunit delta' [Clostridia bacterium]